jgi:hypothetical protein
MRPLYVPLSLNDDNIGIINHVTSTFEMEGNDEEGRTAQEMDTVSSEQPMGDDESGSFNWSNPWLPASVVSLVLVAPVLIGNILVFFFLFGNIWTTTPFVIHLLGSLLGVRCHVCREQMLERTSIRLLTSVAAVLDILLFAGLYPRVWNFIVGSFFTDFDGTDIIEWSHYKSAMQMFGRAATAIAFLRSLLGTTAIIARCFSHQSDIDFVGNSRLKPWLSLFVPWRGQAWEAPHTTAAYRTG